MGRLNLCDLAVPEITNPSFKKVHYKWLYDGVTQILKHKTEFGSTFPRVTHTSKWAQVVMDADSVQDPDPLKDINGKFRLEYAYKNK